MTSISIQIYSVPQFHNEICHFSFYSDEVTKATMKPKVVVRADIVLIIDSSISLRDDQFKAEKEFAKKLVQQMAVGANGARFAALTFASYADVSDLSVTSLRYDATRL